MPPQAAHDLFGEAFGKPVARFVDSFGDLMLGDGKCNTAKKARALAAIIASNAEVDRWRLDKGVISLNWNQNMGDGAAKIILDALINNHTVKRIFLTSNKLTDAIVPTVESVLKARDDIFHVGLSGNFNFISDGARSALEATGGINSDGKFRAWF